MNGFVEPVIETYNCTKNEADTAVLVIPMASSLIFGKKNRKKSRCKRMFRSIMLNGVPVFWGQNQYYRWSVTCRNQLCYWTASQIYLSSDGVHAGIRFALNNIRGKTLALSGIGCGLMRNSIISIQCEYFKKKRNTVMAAISIGPGLGIFVLPRTLKWIMLKVREKHCSTEIKSSFSTEAGDLPGTSCRHYTSFRLLWHCSLQNNLQSKPAHFRSLLLSKSACFMFCQSQVLVFQVCKKIEFDFHLIACFFASSVSFIYLANILILMTSENIEEQVPVNRSIAKVVISSKEVLYGYQGLASILGKFVLTFVMSLNRVGEQVKEYKYSIWMFRFITELSW